MILNGFLFLFSLSCIRGFSADPTKEVGVAPVLALTGYTNPNIDRRRSTVTCTSKSVCARRESTCLTDATQDCLSFQECTGGWKSYCEETETQCTGGMVNKCQEWGYKCSKGWKNVCTKTSEQCREFLPEPFDFLCNVWETICLETSKICKGFQSVCTGGYKAVCGAWGEMCVLPTRICDGVSEVCLGASTAGCEVYGDACTAYVDVCEVVADVVEVVETAAEAFAQCMTDAFSDDGKKLIDTACMEPVGTGCYATGTGFDGFAAGCSLPDLSLSVMFGSAQENGDKETAIFSIEVGGVKLDVPVFKKQWTSSPLMDFLAIDASVDFTWVNDAKIEMTGLSDGVDFELTLPGLFWDFHSSLTLMADYTNDPCAADEDSCKMILNKGRTTLLDKTFAAGPIPVVIEITAEVYLMMRPKLVGSTRLDAKLYFDGAGVELLSTISTPLDDAAAVLTQLTSMFDPSAIIDEMRQKLRFELSGAADATASLGLCVGVTFGFKVNSIGTEIDVPVCLTAELSVDANADLSGAELTMGTEIYINALEVSAELDLPLASAAIDTACGFVTAVTSSTPLTSCVAVVGCFDDFINDICDGISDALDVIDIDQHLATLEIFPKTSIWSGEFTISTSSGTASAPTTGPSDSPSSFSAQATWALQATGCPNADVATQNSGAITYWEGKTINTALRDMWKYCHFTKEGTATAAQTDLCCGAGQTCTPTECDRLSVLDWSFEDAYVLGDVGTNDCPDGYLHITDVYECEKATAILLPGMWHEGHDGYDFGTTKPKGCFQSTVDDSDGYVYFNDDDIGGPQDGYVPLCQVTTLPEGYTMAWRRCDGGEYSADQGTYGYEDTPDVATCAAQCDSLESCVSFIWREGVDHPCRLSYTCTLETAGDEDDSWWQGYFKDEATTVSSCGMEQYQDVYIGCGAVYVMERDREEQCFETFAIKAQQAFEETGCPNPDVLGHDADQVAWWEERESMADIFYDMWLYCNHMQAGTGNTRQVEMCCGAGQTCVPTTCTQLSLWPGNHWGTMVLDLEGASSSLTHDSCGWKRGQQVWTTDCGVYVKENGYDNAMCLKVENDQDVWTPISWTQHMPIIFDSWLAPEDAWIPYEGYKVSQSSFTDKTVRTLQATKAACEANVHCGAIGCDADDQDQCFMGWSYNAVRNSNYDMFKPQTVPGAYYMHADTETTFPVELATADKLDMNNQFTIAAWVRRTSDAASKYAIFGTDEMVTNKGLHLGLKNGIYHMGFYYNGCTSSTQNTVNQWEHIAYTWVTNHMKIYVNGVLVKKCTGSAAFEGTGMVNIGQALSASNKWEHWAGSIKDVRVFKNALSDKELTGLFYLNSHYGQDIVDHGIVVWCEDNNDIPLYYLTTTMYTFEDAQEACLTDSQCQAISCSDCDTDACCNMRYGLEVDKPSDQTVYRQC